MQNEIQVGRFNGVLSKLLGITGAPAPVSATDVFPMLALEVDRPEWHFLGGGRICMGGTYVAAVAAQTQAVQLYNPVDSGVLVVIDSLQAHRGSSGNIIVKIGSAALASSSAGRGVRDTRAYGQAPTAQVRYQSAVATPTGTSVGYVYDYSSSPTARIEAGIVLSPGYGVSLYPDAQNVSMLAEFFWRERAMEPSETR